MPIYHPNSYTSRVVNPVVNRKTLTAYTDPTAFLFIQPQRVLRRLLLAPHARRVLLSSPATRRSANGIANALGRAADRIAGPFGDAADRVSDAFGDAADRVAEAFGDAAEEACVSECVLWSWEEKARGGWGEGLMRGVVCAVGLSLRFGLWVSQEDEGLEGSRKGMVTASTFLVAAAAAEKISHDGCALVISDSS